MAAAAAAAAMFGMNWGRGKKAEIQIAVSGYRTILPRFNDSLDYFTKTYVLKSVGFWYVLKIK